MQQGQTSRGKKSHLQFSLPLGNNTWRTHLPWLIFLGIRDLSGLNPIWKLSFLSFSYRILRFFFYFKEQASKIQAANVFFLTVFIPFKNYLLMDFWVGNYVLKPIYFVPASIYSRFKSTWFTTYKLHLYNQKKKKDFINSVNHYNFYI